MWGLMLTFVPPVMVTDPPPNTRHGSATCKANVVEMDDDVVSRFVVIHECDRCYTAKPTCTTKAMAPAV